MTTRLQKNVKQYFKDNIGIIGALLILCIFLSVFPKTSGSFLTQKNIFNVLRQISSNLFLACGMTMVIILGGIDLSVGSIIALSGCRHKTPAGQNDEKTAACRPMVTATCSSLSSN